MHTLIILGIVVVLVAKVIGVIYLVQWWKERSLRKEQERAVNDFVSKMDERNRRR